MRSWEQKAEMRGAKSKGKHLFNLISGIALVHKQQPHFV